MPVATKSGISLLTGGISAIGAAYAATIVSGTAPAWAPWCVAIGSSASAVALFVLGTPAGRTHSARVAVLLGALFLVLALSFGAAIALEPSEGAGGPIVLGLPLRLAIVFYGVGFIPLLALPLMFAFTFRDRE